MEKKVFGLIRYSCLYLLYLEVALLIALAEVLLLMVQIFPGLMMLV